MTFNRRIRWAMVKSVARLLRVPVHVTIGFRYPELVRTEVVPGLSIGPATLAKWGR